MALMMSQASEVKSEGQGKDASQSKEEEKKMEIEAEAEDTNITNNIICYISGESFKSQILGYGIYQEKILLSTPAELLSYVEYSKNGIRQSSNKTPFTNYLPAFICPKHSILNPKWVQLCEDSIHGLGQMINASSKEEVITVLPKIMNSMIVEMKKSAKAQAILYFEGLCNIWRMLYWFVSTKKDLQKIVLDKINKFTQSENERHKDKVPDLGLFLALYTSVSDQINYEKFVDALLDENFIRCVMWWRETVSKASQEEVFKATEVSRDILLFQMTLVRELIGSNPAATAAQMDKTYCTMPGTLDKF